MKKEFTITSAAEKPQQSSKFESANIKHRFIYYTQGYNKSQFTKIEFFFFKKCILASIRRKLRMVSTAVKSSFKDSCTLEKKIQYIIYVY